MKYDDHCRPRPCPPPTTSSSLPPSGCVPLQQGNERGGIFDAPWIPYHYKDAVHPTVPTNCPAGSGRPLPGIMSGPGPAFAPSPYSRPVTVPGACPPPCPPDPCPPQLTPMPPAGYPRPRPPKFTPQRPPRPQPPTYTPQRPPRPEPPTYTPQRPPEQPPTYTPHRPAVPTPRIPTRVTGPDRPIKVHGPTRKPTPIVPQLYGFGAYGNPPSVMARQSGIFDTPRCPSGSGVPFAPSPYADPRTVPGPCPPRPCPPPPCPVPDTTIMVPDEPRCPDRPRPIPDCPPERFPVVPPPRGCDGFGAGPDGLGFWR